MQYEHESEKNYKQKNMMKVIYQNEYIDQTDERFYIYAGAGI